MGVVRAPWALTLLLVLVAVTTVWMFAYSYLIWRTDPDKTPPAGTLPAEDA